MLCCSGESLFALGERLSIRGVGMAGATAAVSSGLDAAGINPANIALAEHEFFGFTVVPIGFHAGGDVLSYGVYSEYFTGIESINGRASRYLSEADKQAILSRFEGGSGRSNVDIEARMLGVSLRMADLGILAFTVSDVGAATLEFPDDYALFLLYGNPLGSRYEFEGTALTATWMREYAASFARCLEEVPGFQWLAIGATAKLVHGFGYYEIIRSDSWIETSSYGVLTGQVDFLARVSESSTLDASGFDVFPRPAGHGWGLDVGFSGGITEFLRFGASVTDIGTVTWFANTQELSTHDSISFDNPLDPNQQNALIEAISGSEQKATSSFMTRLPATVRAGIALELHKTDMFVEMPGELLLGFDYAQGLENAMSFSGGPRFSFGAEYSLVPWLPLRTGVRFGRDERAQLAFGFGVHVENLQIDLASEDIGWVLSPSGASTGSFAAGVSLQF